MKACRFWELAGESEDSKRRALYAFILGFWAFDDIQVARTIAANVAEPEFVFSFEHRIDQANSRARECVIEGMQYVRESGIDERPFAELLRLLPLRITRAESTGLENGDV